MKLGLAKGLAGALATTLASVALVGLSTAAHASTTPPYEPDPNAVSNGFISLYNAAGTQIFTGSTNSQPFATYAVGSKVVHAGDTSAELLVAQPSPTTNIGNWNVDVLTNFTPYPVPSSAPANIQTLSQTRPVATGTSADQSLNQFIAVTPNTKASDSNTAYQDLYQLRLKTRAPNNVQTSTYDAADVLVNETANTWQQVYPAAPTATSTSLTVTPSTATTQGTSVTLTATESPAAAGTVQFFDGSTALGSPVTVSSGSASLSTTALTAGTHSLTATFTPTDTTAFAGSTSAAVSHTVNAPATATTTTLAVSPASPQVAGTTVTLTGTVSPSAATGTLTFLDGTATLGTATVSGGTGSLSTTTLAAGTHSLTAHFTPTSTATYTASTSAAASYVITAPAATNTTTTLTVSPGTTVAHGSPLTLTGTVAPAAAGTVKFTDGSTTLATVTVSSGTATYTTSTLGGGTHSLGAVFTPTSPASYNGSSATPVTVTVTPQATTAQLTASPAGPVAHGTAVTLTGTVSPAVTGTAQFLLNGAALGSPVTLSAGHATLVTSTLPSGTDNLSVRITPSDTASYAGATSNTLAYVVKAVPTTVSISASPASPAKTPLTLSAAVSPSTVPGTVQFRDGSTALGSPVTVSSGHASLVTSAPSPGVHTFSAVFTPTDAIAYAASTSGNLSYTVLSGSAATTTVGLTTSPMSTVAPGAPVTLTATLSPSAATGTVQFRNGSTNLGAPVPVAGGKATFTTSALSLGAHTLSAVFTPADYNADNPATSAPVTLTVAYPVAVTLTVTPSAPTVGSAVTFTALLNPAGATGTVQFLDGTTLIGTAKVVSGKAVFTLSSLAAGTHMFSARFLSGSTSYTTGTSTLTTVVAVPASIPPVTGTVSPSPIPGPVVAGTGSRTPSGGVLGSTASRLPYTGGGSLAPLTVVGWLLLLLGGAAVVVSRRSRALGTHRR